MLPGSHLSCWWAHILSAFVIGVVFQRISSPVSRACTILFSEKAGKPESRRAEGSHAHIRQQVLLQGCSSPDSQARSLFAATHSFIARRFWPSYSTVHLDCPLGQNVAQVVQQQGWRSSSGRSILVAEATTTCKHRNFEYTDSKHC